MNNEHGIILAIYPNHRGMGYVICRTPKDIIDYGLAYLKRLSPNHYVKRLHKFIKMYRPQIVILKNYGEGLYRTSSRVRKVIETLEFEAYKEGLTVHRYSRSQMITVFSQFGDTNKYGISETLSRWYPHLSHLIAPPRTETMTEDHHMGIFDAHALMCTHFSLISPMKNSHESKNH